MSYDPLNIVFLNGKPIAHAVRIDAAAFAEAVEPLVDKPMTLRIAPPYNCEEEIDEEELFKDICGGWHSGVAIPSDEVKDDCGRPLSFLILEDPWYWADAKSQLESDGYDPDELEDDYVAYCEKNGIEMRDEDE